MKIVICGAGQVGFGIAEVLSREQNDVTVIDRNPVLVKAISDQLDVQTVIGHGAHPEVLKQAGCDIADMIIGVTLYDEVNMAACQVAHSIFNVPTKVARIRSQAYLDKQWGDLFSRDHSPIDVIISPEIEVGETVVTRLSLPGAFEMVGFVEDKIALVGINCDENCPIIDTPIKQLTELFPDLFSVIVAIERQGELIVVNSSEMLVEGDNVYLIADYSQVSRLLGIFGKNTETTNHVVIAGGGNIGLYVAKRLESLNRSVKVKIIENQHERAEFIADELSNTLVLHGSALDAEILREAGVAHAGTFVSLTNNDQVNMLASVMAKNEGATTTACLLSSDKYTSLIPSLGIDAYINPKSTTISKILQYVRRGRIRGVHSILNGQGEIIEAEALSTSPLVKKPLRDVHLPDGVRLGAIVRGDKIIMPNGGSIIQAGDRVVMFAKAGAVKQVEQLFRVSIDYF
ncbi:MAG: Trk system potassium transporter TrkA [Rhizobiales bacterium]|nr:Trk system potassium transporter TrkA [Hyphomicrobiales bacterium]NRB14859.1 Trk system potassium transporter TrkA [Hyphomicrobiales bacterium]